MTLEVGRERDRKENEGEQVVVDEKTGKKK
jgi:hypothetical protein